MDSRNGKLQIVTVAWVAARYGVVRWNEMGYDAVIGRDEGWCAVRCGAVRGVRWYPVRCGMGRKLTAQPMSQFSEPLSSCSPNCSPMSVRATA